MFCTTPITIYKRGEGGVVNPATGQVERSMVACGQCPTCQAGRKNDWSGRLIAEATTAKSVYFLTLTYKKEPTEFAYIEVQKMMKHLRTDLARNHPGTGVRFFCVGERGNKFGRIHWHLLLFFDRPHHLRRTKPRELWQFWQHGWTSIDHVPQNDIVRRVRYCAKYAVKTVGNENACRLRCSLKPAIGGAFLKDFAVQLAETGLPVKGFFFLPGMIWERGHRKGEHVRYRLKGASARMVCRTYCETWERVRPQKAWPKSNFLSRYYPEEMMERFRLWPDVSRPPLGRLALDAMPRLSFRAKENHFNHLNGVAVNVFETQEERIERERLETRIEARRQAHRDFSEDNAHRPAQAFRDTQARGAGLDTQCHAVARYIESGIVTDDLRQTEGFQRLFERIEADGIGDTPHQKPSVPPRDSRADAFAEARWAEKQRIRAAGFDCAEYCDDETGEVLIRAVARNRGAKPPEKAEARGGEVAWHAIGEFARKAVRWSIGSKEQRDAENKARENV